jgi:hypothetical protein
MGANRIKGEVAFSVEDGDLAGDYVLLLDFNALCDLETDLPGLMDGTAEIKTPSAIRAVFHAGLQARQKDVSLHDAGDIIHALGIEQAGDLVRQSFEASFSQAKGGEESDRPRKASAKAGAGNGR